MSIIITPFGDEKIKAPIVKKNLPHVTKLGFKASIQTQAD